MIQGNYTAKALATLPRLRSALVGMGYQRDAGDVDLLGRLLRRSSVFSLPDRGFLFERRFDKYKPEIYRLPYQNVAIEYFVSESGLAEPGEINVPRRLLVLSQGDSEVSNLLLSPSRMSMSGHAKEVLSTKAIFVILMTDTGGQGMWWPLATGAVLPNDPAFAENAIAVRQHGTSAFAIQPLVMCPDVKADNCSKRGISPEDAIQAWVSDLSYESEVVFQFLCALECRNVRVDNLPPPSRLQAKRLRDKKLPLVTYKVLTLDVEPAVVQQQGEGAHASPRTHLRRGHIRRLTKGNIWVNATVVKGKTNGLVLKDYRVAA